MDRTSPTLRRMRRSASQTPLPVTTTPPAPRSYRHRQREPRMGLKGENVYGEALHTLWTKTRTAYGKAGYHGGVAVAAAFSFLLIIGFWISRRASVEVSGVLEETRRWESHNWHAGHEGNGKMEGLIGDEEMAAIIEEKKKLGAKIHGTEYKPPGTKLTDEELAARHANHVQHMHPNLAERATPPKLTLSPIPRKKEFTHELPHHSDSHHMEDHSGSHLLGYRGVPDEDSASSEHVKPPSHNPYFGKTHHMTDDHDGKTTYHGHHHGGPHSGHTKPSAHSKHVHNGKKSLLDIGATHKGHGHSTTSSEMPHTHKQGHAIGGHENPSHHHRHHHHSESEEEQKPIILFVEKKLNGLGSQVLRLIDAHAFAETVGAELVTHTSRYWNYGCAPWHGWECYFLPISFLSHRKPGLNQCTELSELDDARIWSEACIKISTPESSTRARLAHIEQSASPVTPEDDLPDHNSLLEKGPGGTHTGNNIPLAHMNAPKGRFHRLRDNAISAALLAARNHQLPFQKSASGERHPKNTISLPKAQAHAAKVFRLAPSTKSRILQHLLSSGLDIRHRESVVWSSRQQRKDYAGQPGHSSDKGTKHLLKFGPTMAGKEPFVGIHLRRGDKSKEVPDVPLSKYVEAVDIVSPKTASVFIASDDGRALKKLKKLLEKDGRTVLSVHEAVKRKGHTQAKANKTPLKHNRPRVETLLAEIHALAKADWFIGTFSSNMGRLVHTLRHHRAPLTSISLDDRWAPGVAFTTFKSHYCDADDANYEYCKVVRKGSDLSHIVVEKDPMYVHAGHGRERHT